MIEVTADLPTVHKPEHARALAALLFADTKEPDHVNDSDTHSTAAA